MTEPSLGKSLFPQLDETQKKNRFHHLMYHVLLPALKEGRSEFTPFQRNQTVGRTSTLRERAEQERAILSLLMNHINMDPTLVGRVSLAKDDGNWLERFHSSMEMLVPTAFVKVYRDPPSTDDWDLMVSEYSQGTGEFEFGGHLTEEMLLKPYRERGWLFKAPIMYHFNSLVVDALQHCASFAIPNQAILDTIRHYGPVVEVGAGTGYWTALLIAHGVDIIGYDKAIPSADQNSSQFFDRRYTTILQGDASSEAFWTENGMLSTRTLLIVWPNNPDKLDNPQFYYGEDIPSVWDVDCLTHYVTNGGQTVIYVGEREDKITTLPDSLPDCGICSSRRFQNMLKEHFDMVEQVSIPHWYWCEDDATFWRRKTY